jgi:hypothetical protein
LKYWRFCLVTLILGTCALQAGAQAPPSNLYVFPLFVDGVAGAQSFKSTLRIASTTNTNPVNCMLAQRNTSASLTGASGYLYYTFVVTGDYSPLSETTINQPLSLSSEILRTSAQGPLKTGYVELSCPAPAQASVQYAYYDASGNKLGEATVQPATKGNSFQFLIDRRDGTRLGFSLTNDSAIQGQYRVIARDQFNQVIAFNINDTVQPWSQVSKFVDEELSGLPANFVGTIEIVGVKGSQSYAVGLQFTGSVFTTVQPLVSDTPLPFSFPY